MRLAPRLAAALALAAAATALPLPGSPTPDAEAAPPRVRFEAPPGESLLVHGTYPPTTSSCVDPFQPRLHARYRGTIEVRKAPGGSLSLIGELDFEDYLKGIAEVPRHWPMEALKAQVVAARTYALVRLAREGARSYDLCATDACQVYLGMGVEQGPWGERWIRAVEETEGEVLLHGGRPAETLYFSTSNGRTYGNQRVFGGAPLPYLRGIREGDDAESPLSRWQVRMPLGDLARFLGRAGSWPGGDIRRVSDDGHRVRLRGPSGTRIVERAQLRSALNAWARCLAPDRYPNRQPDGYRLPQTVPSVWYRARQDGDDLVLEGRGWGHGVGMVQWGAKGKADRGLAYHDILAAYYGGLRPQRVAAPGRIRVLLAEGLRTVTVEPSGPVEVSGVARLPDPPWRLSASRPLRPRHAAAPRPELQPPDVRVPATASPGERLRVRLDLAKSANIRLELTGEDGRRGETPWRPAAAGDGVAVRVPVPPLPPGTYRVVVAASDGVDLVRTRAGRIELIAGEAGTPASPPADPAGTPAESPAAEAPSTSPASRTVPIAAGGSVVALAGLLALLTARRRRRLHRGP